MKQYEFELRQFQGRREYVMCTARTVEIARDQIAGKYAPEFAVSDMPTAEYKAHKYFAEIDASMV